MKNVLQLGRWITFAVFLGFCIASVRLLPFW